MDSAYRHICYAPVEFGTGFCQDALGPWQRPLNSKHPGLSVRWALWIRIWPLPPSHECFIESTRTFVTFQDFSCRHRRMSLCGFRHAPEKKQNACRLTMSFQMRLERMQLWRNGAFRFRRGKLRFGGWPLIPSAHWPGAPRQYNTWRILIPNQFGSGVNLSCPLRNNKSDDSKA